MTKEEFIGQPNEWGSHRRLLWYALEATEGMVVEFGIGEESTPFLNAYCAARNRQLESYESNKEWFDKMQGKYSHPIHHTINWDFVHLVNVDVLLIDHAPGERRKTDVYRFSEKAKIIVIHDTEPQADHGYQFSTIWKYFKYRIDDSNLGTWTTAVSNFVDVTKWAL